MLKGGTAPLQHLEILWGFQAMKRRANSKGFTLIELMIVVAIIGILAALAIPNFLTYQARSRQTEVWINLGGIYVSQVAYSGSPDSNDSYGTALTGGTGSIGFVLMGTPRYHYDMSGSNGPVVGTGSSIVCTTIPTSVGGGITSTFQAIGCANIDADAFLDEWQIVSPQHATGLMAGIPIVVTNDVVTQ